MGKYIPNEMEAALGVDDHGGVATGIDSGAEKTVFEIVENYLKASGFDGLYNGYADCACVVGDLSPCGEMSGDCQAGYKFPCNCGDHDFHIGSAEERILVTKETEEP